MKNSQSYKNKIWHRHNRIVSQSKQAYYKFIDNDKFLNEVKSCSDVMAKIICDFAKESAYIQAQVINNITHKGYHAPNLGYKIWCKDVYKVVADIEDQSRYSTEINIIIPEELKKYIDDNMQNSRGGVLSANTGESESVEYVSL